MLRPDPKDGNYGKEIFFKDKKALMMEDRK